MILISQLEPLEAPFLAQKHNFKKGDELYE